MIHSLHRNEETFWLEIGETFLYLFPSVDSSKMRKRKFEQKLKQKIIVGGAKFCVLKTNLSMFAQFFKPLRLIYNS